MYVCIDNFVDIFIYDGLYLFVLHREKCSIRVPHIKRE